MFVFLTLSLNVKSVEEGLPQQYPSVYFHGLA